jgi:hypothetical protein
MNAYPPMLYPTILAGKIVGKFVRFESMDGSELIKPIPGGVMTLKNFRPFIENEKMWGVTHMQKFSTSGWLKVNPDAYHWWKFWRLQKQDSSGGWLPGTESGIYYRRPFAWRWDIAGTPVDGILKHWIRTKGYLGGRWD